MKVLITRNIGECLGDKSCGNCDPYRSFFAQYKNLEGFVVPVNAISSPIIEDFVSCCAQGCIQVEEKYK